MMLTNLEVICLRDPQFRILKIRYRTSHEGLTSILFLGRIRDFWDRLLGLPGKEKWVILCQLEYSETWEPIVGTQEELLVILKQNFHAAIDQGTYSEPIDFHLEMK